MRDQGGDGNHHDSALQDVDEEPGQGQLYRHDQEVQHHYPSGASPYPLHAYVSVVEEVEDRGEDKNLKVGGSLPDEHLRSSQQGEEEGHEGNHHKEKEHYGKQEDHEVAEALSHPFKVPFPE